MISSGRANLGIFATAAAVILYEIALTRVFAIMLWHHLTYMVVAIAMLGFGAAGSAIAATREEPARPERKLAWLGLAFALTTLLATRFGAVIRLDVLKLLESGDDIAALLLFYVVLALPMFFGGLVVGWLLRLEARRVHRLYSFDLAGSALGAVVAVQLLDELGAVATTQAAATLAALGAFVLAKGLFLRILAGIATLALLFGTLAVGGGLEPIGIPAVERHLPIAIGKEMASERIERRIPGATAEVEIGEKRRMLPILGGEYPLDGLPEVSGRLVAQDGTAPTMLYEHAARLDSFPFLGRSQADAGRVALNVQGKTSPDVLVIGVGGGVDVMTALATGAASVTAVEVNSAMIRMVTEDFDSELDGLFTRKDAPFDRIELIHGEGRSYLNHSDRRFDLIQLSGVDSFTALNTGAYTLSESYLYTVDAMRDLIDHLEPGGIVALSRFILGRPRRPRETLRLAGVARQALAEEGLDDPAGCIAVLQGRRWAVTLLRRGPFSPAEIEALRAFAEAGDFRGLVFDPLAKKDAEFPLEPPPLSATALYARDWLRGRAPLLFPGETAAIAGQAVAELALAELRGEPRVGIATSPGLEAEARDVLELARETLLRELREDTEHFRRTRRDFATLLRGDEDERAAFIAGYPYRLEPCRDDDPFFFNYYRWSGLFDAPRRDGVDNLYHPDFPIGHAVLLASLLQVIVLAAILILLPLARLRAERVATPGRYGFLVYFAALGLGFMLVEIALMQKLALFLGHPTRTLAVVLSGILAFSAIGARLSALIGRPSKWKILLLGLVITAVVAASGRAADLLTASLLGASTSLRVLAALGLLLPVGLVLGAAFPTGISVVESRAPRLVPWAFGVNGFTSVLGGIVAILVAQEIGFTKVLFVAAGVYVVGALALPGASAATSNEVPADEADERHRE